MPTKEELEELTNKFLDDMMMLKGVDFHGRKAESAEVVGSMGERVRSDCVSGKDVLQD